MLIAYDHADAEPLAALYSAVDAYIRGYELTAPPGAAARIDPELGRAALAMMERNMHASLG